MKVGDAYKLEKITLAEWLKFAASIKPSSELISGRINYLASALPKAVESEVTKLQSTVLDHPVLRLLKTALTRRAEAVSKSLST
tara:strand:- start:5162 stop:5413 length:252 start_codon:yes stop_codon:yes gene_type:complete